jgi:hypothetical protein
MIHMHICDLTFVFFSSLTLTLYNPGSIFGFFLVCSGGGAAGGGGGGGGGGGVR